MHYTIQGAFLGLGREYAILYEFGERVYLGRRALFSWTRKLLIEDAGGTAIVEVSQRAMGFMRSFAIAVCGHPTATVTREFAWFRRNFHLEVAGEAGCAVDGTDWNRTFTFVRRGRVVAVARRPFAFCADKFEVEIADGEDGLLVLTTCLIILLVLRADRAAAS